MQIAPSILAADFARLAEEAAVVADACVTALHSANPDGANPDGASLDGASLDGGGGWTPVPLRERPDFYRI